VAPPYCSPPPRDSPPPLLRLAHGTVARLTRGLPTALTEAGGFKIFETYRAILFLIAGKRDTPHDVEESLNFQPSVAHPERG